MEKLPNHTSLKEWSTVIEALGRGEQVILIRKGGLADPKFGVEAERFYLYPTFFHQPEEASEPRNVTITHWCEVVQSWRVGELDTLRRLEPHVVIPRETLEVRYRFRPDQSLYILGVRAFALPAPVTITVTAGYLGCRSWVSIDDELDVTGSLPALPEGELERKLEAVEAAISDSVP